MGENGSQNKTLELYETLPFMESFPFEEYEIEVETEGNDPAELGVAPILLNVLGTFGQDEKIIFNYFEKGTAIQISFHLEDVAAIADSSSKIKKLNIFNEILNTAVISDSIEKKIEIIKESKKLIKLLDCENLLYAPFTEVLKDMLELYQVSLTSLQLLGVQKLQSKKLEEDNLSSNQKEAILSYFNFQLHYARIILGVVIAAKIH